MVMILPIYEEDIPGVYYNTAVVVDADGTILGKYRKHHLPNLDKFWEKFYFRPGNLGYPVFQTAVGPIGVYICYDRHFPEGWRELGLNGAQIVFNPNATKPGLSNRLWEIEQPAAAAANGYFVAAPNRVGTEDNEYGELAVTFYGSSQFVDPTRQPGRADGQQGDRGGGHPRPRHGHGPAGPQRLAVLPRPPPRLLHRDHQAMTSATCARNCRQTAVRGPVHDLSAAARHGGGERDTTLIKGGTVVNATGTAYAPTCWSTARRSPRVLAPGSTLLGADLERDVDQVVDATGKYVIPGGIDAAHPHGAAVRRHRRLGHLRDRYPGRGLGRHHHDHRLRGAALRRAGRGRAGRLARQGRGQLRDRLRLPPDHRRHRRVQPQGDGHA